MSNTYVTLDEFMNEQGNHVKQVVYKVDGDFVGDIKGDNVTVILMGDGDFVGDIDSKDGEVVLIKGNINGNVKANKVVCPKVKEETINKSDRHVTCKSCKFYGGEINIGTKNIYMCKHNNISWNSMNDFHICQFYEKSGFKTDN